MDSTKALREKIIKRRNNYSTPGYAAWSNMISRCTNKNHEHYDYYGGRGITVCDRWRSFKNFYEDMGERPPGYTLDRIDNNGNYEPGNCRWASWTTQAINKRMNKLNTSGHTGVVWHKASGRWRAVIIFQDQIIALGYFRLKEDARACRLAAEEVIHAEYK